MASRNGRPGSWIEIIKSVGTPLEFHVLSLLVVETMLALVLRAQLEPGKRYYGFLWMIGIFIGVVVVVTLLTVPKPKNLLYGQEEHLTPQLDDSALRDQIEDIVVRSVKSECLKNPQS